MYSMCTYIQQIRINYSFLSISIMKSRSGIKSYICILSILFKHFFIQVLKTFDSLIWSFIDKIILDYVFIQWFSIFSLILWKNNMDIALKLKDSEAGQSFFSHIENLIEIKRLNQIDELFVSYQIWHLKFVP